MADPIDTQNVFSKTVQVQKLQQTQLQQPINEQEGFADQMRKSTDKKLSQVRQADESQLHKTEDQQQEQRQEAEARKRRSERDAARESEADRKYDVVRGKIIDVEV